MNDKINFIIAQINPVVGDISANTERIIDIVIKNRELNSTKIFVFPELALCGYSPEDLLFRQDFVKSINKAIDKIRKFIEINEYIIFGSPYYSSDLTKIWNSAFVINNKDIINIYKKQILPNYGVFDEKRYFEKGDENLILDISGNKICILICEDTWDFPKLHNKKIDEIDFLVSINASPYEKGKDKKRRDYFKEISKKYNFNLIYLNTVGGQDEIVFDGSSFLINRNGDLVHSCMSFSEEIYNFKIKNNEFFDDGGFNDSVNILSEINALYEAVKIGTYDYITKSKFDGVVLGLSGGIDSALTLAIASDIFERDKIEAVMMPSKYTSDLSIQLAKEQCEILNIRYSLISIKEIYKIINDSLRDRFSGFPENITEENIQARVRGLILMSISNKTGQILLTTGNKSELAVGYSTLYGDMCGSFAPLKDLYKSDVYALSKFRNKKSLVIPEAVIERMPTAELSDNQYDIDTLPPYEVLDDILNLFIEEKKSLLEICQKGYDKDLIANIINMVIRSEYKRRQYAPGVKVTPESFGRDRRFPIVSGYKY